MIYLVRTTYCAGVFLSRAAIRQRLGKARFSILEFETYEEAAAAFKKIWDEGDMADVPEEPIPNRFHQIFRRDVYCVVYNKKFVGFVKLDEFGPFLSRSGLMPGMYKTRSRLTYQKAVQMVCGLGARTPKLEFGGWRNPSCGILYRRC